MRMHVAGEGYEAAGEGLVGSHQYGAFSEARDIEYLRWPSSSLLEA